MKHLRFSLITLFALAVFMAGVLAQRASAASPVQIHLDHWQNGCTIPKGKTSCPDQDQKWVDGNLHKTNSTYTEGDFIPTRFVLENLPEGTYNLTFRWLASKRQGTLAKLPLIKHAHDYLSTYNAFAKAGYGAGLDPCKPLVQGGGKGPYVCGQASTADDSEQIPNPDGMLVPNGFTSGAQTFGEFKIWNAKIDSLSVVVPPAPNNTNLGYVYLQNNVPTTTPFTGTSSNSLTLAFTVDDSDPLTSTTKTVVLALGARLAKDDQWTGDQNGACDINGAPYHWSYNLVNVADPTQSLQSGSRDRSIMCTDSADKGSIKVVKQCFNGTVQTLAATDPFASFGFTVPTQPPDNLLPSPFVLGCGAPGADDGNANTIDIDEQSITAINTPAGTYKIKEDAPTFFGPGFGWDLNNIDCKGTNTNGGNVSTYRYLDYVPPTSTSPPATDTPFQLGDRTVEITLKAGDNVTCTFSNGQAKMPLNKLTNGEHAKCTDPTKTLPNQLGDDITGVRPCTYPNGLTLTDSDPRFTVNLYLTDTTQTLNPTTAPTVIQFGTPGTTTYYYWCTATTGTSGETLLSPSGKTELSNPTLSTSNYNSIVCPTVTGASGYKVYRTDTATAPTGTGLFLVDSSATTTINDKSNTLSLATIPTVNTTTTVNPNFGKPLPLGPPGTLFPNGFIAQAKIPPQFEAPGLIGVPLSLCEAPGSNFSLLGVTVLVTDGKGTIITTDDTTSTITPGVYYLSGYGCFNILLPPGTVRFEINMNNASICTYTQGGWVQTAAGGNVGAIRDAGFATVYPSGFFWVGLDIGDLLGDRHFMKFTSSTALTGFQTGTGAGNTLGPLTQNHTDPVGRTESGNFGSQVVALEFNVDYGAAGKLLLSGTSGGIGGFTLTGTGGSLDGSTVATILAAANTALGGGGLPTGYTFSSLTDLVGSLNESFDGCTSAGTVNLNAPTQ